MVFEEEKSRLEALTAEHQRQVDAHARAVRRNDMNCGILAFALLVGIFVALLMAHRERPWVPTVNTRAPTCEELGGAPVHVGRHGHSILCLKPEAIIQ